MADKWLLQDGSGGWLLQDGSGYWILQATAGGGGTALLVVNNSASPTTTDAFIKTILEGLGFTVTYISASASEDLTKDFVFLAESPSSVTLGSKYSTFAGGLVTAEMGVVDDDDLSAGAAHNVGSFTDIVIVDSGHPIAAGLSGTVTVLGSSSVVNLSDYADLPGAAQIVADGTTTGGTSSPYYAYEAGDTMANSHVAEGRRVAIGWIPDSGGSTLTADGIALLEAAITWASGGGAPSPQTVSPGLLTLTLSLTAPKVNQQVAPGLLTLTLTPTAPQVNQRVAPGLITLTLTPTAPQVIGAQFVQPGLITLTLTPTAPTVLVPQFVDPGLITLALTPVAPSIAQQVQPGLITLTLTPTAPQVNLAVQPGLLTLTLTPIAPEVAVAPGVQTVAPGLLTLTLTPTAPSAIRQSVQPDVLVLALTPQQPSLLLGPSPLAGRPVIEYAIEVYNSGATFGPNARTGEIWDARNLGWSRYDRLPGKAFFTLPQTSPNLGILVPLTTHVRFWRITPTQTTLVYQGVVIDYDATGDDVVFSCFDYLALLSISRTGYKTLYPKKAIGSEIVSPEWTLAKNATSSPLGFVTTGTIEDPLGTDGSTVIKTNNQFGLLDQMRLQLFYDLSEMGRANTVNHTTFEITTSTTPTFNFRKNKGSVVGLGFVLGGNVSDYQHLPGWIRYRNNLATIGSTVGGGATEIVVTDASAAAAKGLRQDVFTIKTLLGIVGAATEADQQKAVAERQLKSSLQAQPTLLLRLARGSIDFFNGWDLCDKAPVEIGNGIDNIATNWRILGARATFDEAGENPQVLVQPVVT